MRIVVLSALLGACADAPAEDTGPGETAPDLGAPPSAAEGVTIEPAEPDTLQDLVLGIGVDPTDADGDYAGLQVRWSRDGDPAPTLDDAWTVPASATRRDERWEVSVAGTDAKGNEGPATTASVVIANLAPDVPTVTVSPEAPLAGEDDLVCGAEATDADADELTYEIRWSRDAEVIEGSVVPAARLRSDEVWTCTAVASDGTADSEPGTASVLTFAPPIPNFSLVDRNPSSPRHSREVSPRDYLEKVSGWYFTHAT